MKKLFFILGIIGLFLINCKQSDSVLSEKEKLLLEKEVETAFNGFSESMKKLDAKSTLDFLYLHGEFVNAADGNIDYSGENIANHFNEAFNSFSKFLYMDVPEKYIYIINQEAATVTIKFDEALVLENNDTAYVEGSYIYVYQKIDENWKIVQMAGSHKYN